MGRLLVWAPLGVLILLLGAFAVALLAPNTNSNDPMVGRDLPDLPLTDFPGGRGDFDPDAIEGPYILNIWASWCAPCRIEHPVLQSLHDQGVPIYGVVYKDEPANARRFLAELGDPFAGLAADTEGRAGIEIGMTGAPETLIIDADGVIRARWRGAITDLTWIRTLGPAWEEADGAPVDAAALRVE